MIKLKLKEIYPEEIFRDIELSTWTVENEIRSSVTPIFISAFPQDTYLESLTTRFFMINQQL